MSDTRNFSFRQSPIPQHRLGRFKLGDTPLANGAPVVGGGEMDPSDLRLTVAYPAAGAAPIPGLSGVLNQELPWDAYAGHDTVLTQKSDLHLARAGEQAQVCHGSEVKVLVQNTADSSFEDQRDYEGINMFLPSDLATLEVGNLVTVGACNDSDGYWKKTSTASEAWGTVVEVDADAGLVVFQLKF